MDFTRSCHTSLGATCAKSAVVVAACPTSRSDTVEAHLAGQRVIFTSDPDNIRAIFATQGGDFEKGQAFRDDWYVVLGDSIFTQDRERWHASRQLLRPQFTHVLVSQLDIFEKHIQTLLRAFAGDWAAVAKPHEHARGIGLEIGVTAWIRRFTLDTATDFLFGKEVGSLCNEKDEFNRVLETVKHIQLVRTRAGPLRFLWPKKSVESEMQKIDKVVYPHVDEALRRSKNIEDVKAPTRGYNMLDALAATSKNRVYLRDQAMSLLLAGRDTTSATLTWILYHIAKDEKVYLKLRTEVLDAVGTNPPSYTELKNMKYLQNITKEVLRLYPIPFNTRTAVKDTTLPRGGGPDGSLPIAILKGTGIALSTLELHRRQELMPPPSPESPAVDVFYPERWETWHPTPWHYIPFSGGPRICLGQQFALANLTYTIARVAQKFERLVYLGKAGELQVGIDVMMEPIDEIKIAFFESQSEVAIPNQNRP
ncbi:Cytochrome P450 monooxygenase [Hyphodiscus hymeniophilus]|uniref:Cytochrome P450 monooxygenase n=1 Tax=Hyphodiscus hymeniophilus TaxID=353542 RepID=A0A9P6VJQ7_9HELO|nr:Cytochrome P450 monooxygenase [Hyphodiscus hymeniophilus]